MKRYRVRIADTLRRHMRPSLLLFAACGSVAAWSAEAQDPHRQAAAPPAAKAMEFSDKPDFSVAAVTDWTAVGGHGSDATLRTSEDLTRQTLTLKPAVHGTSLDEVRTPADAKTEAGLRAALAASPHSDAANRALGEYYLHTAQYGLAVPPLSAAAALRPERAEDEYEIALACRGVGDLARARQHVQRALARKDAAEFHRLAGELEEALGDPLHAVQQEEHAARMDPSEANYFAWGSELLLHRAIWQAAEVFARGAALDPASARMRTGWGAALFASALDDEAAQRLCEASDLNPSTLDPYIFMGKLALASAKPLPCVQQRLGRFLQLRPESADATYFNAMVLEKQGAAADRQRVEELLHRTTVLDPKYSAAYLQLGILAFAQRRSADAIELYKKALEADSQQAEAHFRLGVAYDRTGEAERAKREFEAHDRLETEQAAAIEQQRRQVKQFLVVLEAQTPTKPSTAP